MKESDQLQCKILTTVCDELEKRLSTHNSWNFYGSFPHNAKCRKDCGGCAIKWFSTITFTSTDSDIPSIEFEWQEGSIEVALYGDASVPDNQIRVFSVGDPEMVEKIYAWVIEVTTTLIDTQMKAHNERLSQLSETRRRLTELPEQTSNAECKYPS